MSTVSESVMLPQGIISLKGGVPLNDKRVPQAVYFRD
jgi:hypothetical protein